MSVSFVDVKPPAIPAAESYAARLAAAVLTAHAQMFKELPVGMANTTDWTLKLGKNIPLIWT